MIDAAIPMQIQAPQITPPMQLLSQAGNLQQQQANLQATQQEGQQRGIVMQGQQLALAGQQQSAQDQADYRAAMAAAVDPATGQVNRGVLLSTLGKLNPTAAAQTSQTLSQQDTASQEAAQKLQQAQLATASAHVEAKDKLLQGVSDQITYTNALNQGYQLGIIKPGDLPAQYDPQLVQQLHAQTLTQQQALNNQMAGQKEKDSVAQQQATLANTQSYQKAELSQGAQRIGIEGAKLNLDRQKQAYDQGQAADASGTDLATAIASGHIAPDRMAYLLSKNPGLVNAVMQKDPSFDSSKSASYAQAYKDFTSSKNGSAGGALNAGGTALGHLQELSNMNTVASHIPGTPSYNAYMNKVDTVATELAKFYGDSTVSGIGAIRSTLASTLPGTRQAAIKTQAQSMGDKFDAYQQTWDNAAPSKAYEAPMPGISQKAMEARAALDPSYHAKAVAATQQGVAGATPPPGATHTVPGSDGKMHYTDGKSDLGVVPQ
jgi:hypothetical protein